jgi:adenylate cyclase
MRDTISDVKYASNDELWRNMLSGSDPELLKLNRLMKRLPRGPRCKLCSAPFSKPGSLLVAPFGFRRWTSNPSLCGICVRGLDKVRGGTEIDATFLFADIRGSTSIAERTSPAAFHALLERFYTATGRAVDEAGGLVDKYMGDGIVAIFVPAFSEGREPAAAAVDAALGILAATSDEGEPWLPVGVGVHRGTAYVGVIGSEGGQLDFTGVGDAVNIAARLGSEAAAGEVLVSIASADAAGVDRDGLETRHLALKGRDEPVDVVVLHARQHTGAVA